MKIALVIPPLSDFYFTPHRFSSLGAARVEEILTQEGYAVTRFNFPLQDTAGTPRPLPPELAYLKPFFLSGERGPVSFFRGYRRFGPPPEDAARTVLAASPDLICICLFAWCYSADTAELLQELQNMQSRIPVLAGGAGAAAWPEYLLSRGADYIYLGEAEEGLVPFLQAFAGGVRRNFRLHYIKERASGGDVTPSAYRPAQFAPPVGGQMRKDASVRITLAITRGCPKGCRFCSVPLHQGKVFRWSDTCDLIDSIHRVADGHKVGEINIEDDNLLMDPERFVGILEILHKNFPDARILCENGIDYRMLQPAMLAVLQKTGFRSLNMSLVSADRKVLLAEERSSSLEHYQAIAAAADKLGMDLISYFICGLAEDTPESVVNTLLFLQRLPGYTGISLFYPVPGLRGYENAEAFGPLLPRLWAGSSAYPWNGTLTTSQLITAFRLSRMGNLLKQPQLSPQEKELLRRARAEKRLFTYVRRQRRLVLCRPPAMDSKMENAFFEGLLRKR